MAKQSFFLAVVLAVLPFVACHGDNKDDNATNDKYDVYVTGEHSLWKNGVRQNLAAGRSIDGNSVFVSGQDVYVAGTDRTDPLHNYNAAVLWTNGTVARLGTGDGNSGVNSVFVSGRDVYVAGYEDVNRGERPRLWVNGVRQALEGDDSIGIANCVFVSPGGHVYVVGRCRGAALWIDGSLQILENGATYGEAFSVYVSDDKVYVVGRDGLSNFDNATLWVDGAAQRIGVKPVSVHVSGEDVYIAGQGDDGAVLWKNGYVQKLSGGNYPRTAATGLFVVGGETFVSGYAGNQYMEYAMPTVWVGDKARFLAQGAADIIAFSVYAVEKAK